MSIDTRKKSKGRPPVDSQEISVRMLRDDVNALDAWRADQADNPNRPEAIRRLVRRALQES